MNRQTLSDTNALQAVVDHSSAMIALADLAGRYLLVNRAWAALIDTTPAEVEGKTVRDLFRPPLLDRIESANRRVMEDRSAHEFEDVVVDASGERTLLTVQFPLFEPGGSMCGIGSIATDISARKQQENMIRRLNGELALKAASLASVNQELQALSYSVSHDLKAPLRGIDGFGRMLFDGHYEQLDDKGKDLLRRVVGASAHMGKLFDGLLNLSRIGRQALTMRQVDLSAVAREAVNALAQANPERSVEASIEPELTAWADPGLMRIVMDHLVGNAWKFSAKSAQARIEIGSTRRDGDTVVYVRDNGVGFDMTYSDKLFRPFQRLHGAKEFEGTGIGLATVRRIIERHHGNIRIESAVDGGTSVFFTTGKQS
jgi:PAS domain S-box-containing protein